MKSNLQIKSDLSISTLNERLLRCVLVQSKFKYLTWVERSANQYDGKKFYGVVNKNCFKIVPVVYGRNLFTPIFCGTLSDPEETGSLKIEQIDSPYMKNVKMTLLILLCGTLIAFIYSGDLTCLFAFASCFVVFVGFLLLNRNVRISANLIINESILQ